MNYYNRKILPRMLDASMASPVFTTLRRKLLANVQGQVLEIGIGGGHNLACYPPGVRRIAAVDTHDQLLETAAERARRAGVAVEYHPTSAEHLPFDDGSFDSVVSTWTLCSIPDVGQALAEIRRVLKPDGLFYFVEHGLSPHDRVRFWQNLLTPLQKTFAGGCHLNRDMPALVRDAGFTIATLQTFYNENELRSFGYTFMGTARK